MITVTYCIVEEVYMSDKSSRTAYGIAAYAKSDPDSTATIVASVHDVCSDKGMVGALVQKCNYLKLSTIHLQEIIEDFLSL